MWERIKKILQEQGGKCIILEEGEPAFIVVKLDEKDEAKEEEINKVNRNIDSLKAEEKKQEEPVVLENQEEVREEVKVEDLPF
jgi:pimeloyl-CoA synthetase